MSRYKVGSGSEYAIQKEFVKWIRINHPTVLFCATVGGKSCHMIENVKARATGYNKGVPDLIIYEARGGKHGLAMELKSTAGSLSEEQKKWIADLETRGYKTVVPRSVDECKTAFIDYFKASPNKKRKDD